MPLEIDWNRRDLLHAAAGGVAAEGLNPMRAIGNLEPIENIRTRIF